MSFHLFSALRLGVLLLAIFYSPVSLLAQTDPFASAGTLDTALGLLSAPILPTAAGQISKTDVFVGGEDGYKIFRIPAIIKAPDGSLLAFCEGRVNGRLDSGDIDIVMKRSTDEGQSWSDLIVLWNDGANTCGNPCPVVDEKTGQILLLLTHNNGDDREPVLVHGNARGTRTVWIMRSGDNGKNWTPAQEITASVKKPEWTWYATGPGIGIQVKNGLYKGRLVIPCDHAYPDPQGTLHGGAFASGSHVVYSDDHGQTWRIGGQVGPLMNECQIAELFDDGGSLLLDMRNSSPQKCRAQARSTDGGMMFSEPVYVKTLVDPRCQASIFRWEQASAPGLLVFSNPADAKRRALTLRISEDNAKSWSRKKLLHEGPSGYSCLVGLDGQMVGCLYENGAQKFYERITFARIPIASFE